MLIKKISDLRSQQKHLYPVVLEKLIQNEKEYSSTKLIIRQAFLQMQVIKPTVSASEKRRQTQSNANKDGDLPDIITGNEPVRAPCRNCIGCGFIYSLEEYDKRDQCGFCHRPLTSNNRKENRRRREEGEDEAGLAKAEMLRQRLVAFDQESAARTRITDDDRA